MRDAFYEELGSDVKGSIPGSVVTEDRPEGSQRYSRSFYLNYRQCAINSKHRGLRELYALLICDS